MRHDGLCAPRQPRPRDVAGLAERLGISEAEERCWRTAPRVSALLQFSTRMGLMPIGTFESVTGKVSPSRVRYCVYFGSTVYSTVSQLPC